MFENTSVYVPGSFWRKREDEVTESVSRNITATSTKDVITTRRFMRSRPCLSIYWNYALAQILCQALLIRMIAPRMDRHTTNHSIRKVLSGSWPSALRNYKCGDDQCSSEVTWYVALRKFRLGSVVIWWSRYLSSQARLESFTRQILTFLASFQWQVQVHTVP